MCSKNMTRRDLLVQLLAMGGATLLPGIALGKSISSMQGSVWVNGRLASKNTVIYAGDNIRTGNNSYIVFVVDKDAYQLGENSRLVLRSSFGIIQTLRLLSGSLLAVFSPGRKTISTPTATAGIRGTGIFADVSTDKSSTYFCTCYGSVELSAVSSGEKMMLTADHHNARYVSNATYKPAIEIAPMINHTDRDLIMLESLFGRKPPFA